MQELEKILEEIDNLRGLVGGEDNYINMYVKKTWDDCLDMVQDIIRKHMNDGWIPVENALPEADSMVLVTCRTKKGIMSVNRAYCDGMFWHGTGSMSGVIAWRPLPDPYHAERSRE